DPLDQNQQLMAPAWWTSAFNVNPALTYTTGASYAAIVPTPSGGVTSFEYFFHRLTEPLTPAGGAQWGDPGSAYTRRRAFYSKFLIVSGGPDNQVGVFRYPDASPPTSATQLIANENNALPFGLDVADFTVDMTIQKATIDATTPQSLELQQAEQDDISNQG